jgi:2-dehydro-3-deoxy-D-gluconate 5-dehydrogenase
MAQKLDYLSFGLKDKVGAVLLLSSDLSDMVVGHVLMVDGGWTIH